VEVNKVSKYPEADKVIEAREDAQTIGEFIEWLQADYVIAEWDDEDDLRMAHISIEDLLYKYCGIDKDAYEAEKLAMLKEMENA